MKKETCVLLILCAVCFGAIRAGAATRYVSPTGSDAEAGTSWATAKKTIQSAIRSSTHGDTVLVTNGLYATGGETTTWAGLTTNRVMIEREITVQSVNGPEVTIIQGAWDPGNTNGIGPAAVRGVYLGANAVLSGFTVSNGATRDGEYGGGIYSENSGVVSNCIVTGNSTSLGGGGVHGGTVRHSIISGNRVTGIRGGGGLCNANADNCLIISNQLQIQIDPILALGSAAAWHSGFTNSPARITLDNCTIVKNTGVAPEDRLLSTGLKSGTSLEEGKMAVRNCVMWDNVNASLIIGAGDTYDLRPVDFPNNCFNIDIGISVLVDGAVTNDPQFVDSMAGNYQLKWTSPCRDAGSTNFVASATDLLGGTRIVGASVDIGAYEAVNSDSDQLSDAEEAKYGTNPNLGDSDDDGWADDQELFVYFTNPLLGDSDGDGFPDKFEWDNGYSPTNDNEKVFADYIAGEGGTLGLFGPTNGQVLITFSIESSTNLPSFSFFPVSTGQVQVTNGAIEFRVPQTSGLEFFRLRSE